MILYHTIKTISIGRFIEMTTNSNYKLVKRWGLFPTFKFINKAFYKYIILKFNAYFNGSEIKADIFRQSRMLSILHTLTVVVPAIHKIIEIHERIETKETEESVKRVFKDVLHINLKTVDVKDAMEKLTAYATRLDIKYKQLHKQVSDSKVEEDTDEITGFENLVMRMETVLAPLTLRDKKLYSIKGYYKLYLNKLKDGRD